MVCNLSLHHHQVQVQVLKSLQVVHVQKGIGLITNVDLQPVLYHILVRIAVLAVDVDL